MDTAEGLGEAMQLSAARDAGQKAQLLNEYLKAKVCRLEVRLNDQDIEIAALWESVSALERQRLPRP